MFSFDVYYATRISFTLRSRRLTSPVGLCLDDLTDASRSDAVLCSQLHFVPGTAAQVVQFEGALSGTDENVFPFLCVVHRVLQHKAYTHTHKHTNSTHSIIYTLELFSCFITRFPVLFTVKMRSSLHCSALNISTAALHEVAVSDCAALSSISPPDWRTL